MCLKNYENIHKKMEISHPTLDEEFELPDESYFASNIQGYFECIIKRNNY